ncbi:MAG: hypothetical protein HQM16_18450 [Deltaproteobacteria bacterium]|nr:hypothetical protein [Deltaproteobacteria bacterium]
MPLVTIPHFPVTFTPLTTSPYDNTALGQFFEKDVGEGGPYKRVFEAEATATTGKTDDSFDVLDPAIRRDIKCKIENRRQLVNWAVRVSTKIFRTPSFDRDIISIPNKAERSWLESVANDLQECAQRIFGRQSHHDYQALSSWIYANQRQDPHSFFHFDRTRRVETPRLRESCRQIVGTEVKAHPDIYGSSVLPPDEYANLFPWFPPPPAYHGMFPKNMSATDLEYIMNTYDAYHPIRLPWTIVEDVSADEVLRACSGDSDQNTIAFLHCNHGNTPVAWFVQGNKKWYKVTNMVYHPAFADEFARVQKTLADSLKLLQNGVDGDYLHPSFVKYINIFAEALANGDFETVLRADIEQTGGNLFFTFFPHEGYWPDGIKYPLMFEIGIKQPPQHDSAHLDTATFRAIEKIITETAQSVGVEYYKENGVENADKEAVLIWLYRSGGYLRATAGEPLGHDYPKRSYSGVNKHRTVIMLDAAKASHGFTNDLYHTLIDPSQTPHVHIEDVIDFAIWHERIHATGARPETITSSGRQMISVYGHFWGLLVETLADVGSMLSAKIRHDMGFMSTEDSNRFIRLAITAQFRRLTEKKTVTGPLFEDSEAGSVVASSLILGWLIKNNAVTVMPDNKTIQINEALTSTVTSELFRILTRFSFVDDPDGFKQFSLNCIGYIPDEFEQNAIDAKTRHTPPYLVNRNPDAESLYLKVL